MGEGGGGTILLNSQPPLSVVCTTWTELQIVVLGQVGPQPYGPMGGGHVDKTSCNSFVLKEMGVGNNQGLSGKSDISISMTAR